MLSSDSCYVPLLQCYEHLSTFLLPCRKIVFERFHHRYLKQLRVNVMVKALRYQSDGPGIDSLWCHWGFFPWHRTEPSALGSTQPLKMFNSDFSYVKGGWFARLTTYQPRSAERQEHSYYSYCCLCILLLSMYSYCSSMYSYCSSIYSYRCLCILIVVYVFLDAATLIEVFPCFFLGCKANARV